MKLFIALAKSQQLLDTISFPSHLRTSASKALGTTRAILTLRDFSDLYLECLKPANNMLDALLQYVDGSKSNDKSLRAGLDSFSASITTGQLQNVRTKQSRTTLLGISVEKVFKMFFDRLSSCEDEISSMWPYQGEHTSLANLVAEQVTPSELCSCLPVSYTAEGKENMIMDIPLVHPDQCQMVLRQADAAFFANDFSHASAAYQGLLERLVFVPLLLEERQHLASGAQMEPTSLYKAFETLEKVDRLSFWTMESLAYLYTQVCGRMDQLRNGTDLFGLTKEWAPRLSFQFYSEYAGSQIENLRGFEGSYWAFFDTYQAQMRAGSILREAISTNVYRRNLVEEDIERALQAMRTKETAIETAAGEIKEKKEALMAELERVQGLIDRWHCPSVGTILTGITSAVVIGAFLASNPVGWVVGGMALVAGGSQIWAMCDEAASTIEDTHGQRVNKKYLVNQLNTCGEEFQSLLDKAYAMQGDGTHRLDDDDTKKIAVTESQIKSFLKQFKDSIPEANRASLSKLLDEFVKTTSTRNHDILAYNNAVITVYSQLQHKALYEKQSSELGSELIRENIGLPSVIAYYQRLRQDSRLSILRTVKQSALALRFWGLLETAEFSNPGLLSNIDELQAHVGVLFHQYESSISRLSSFSQSVWPRKLPHPGILYRLSESELAGVKLAQVDPFSSNGSIVYTVCVEGLKQPVTRETTVPQNPFAGRANVRLSQVRCWIPGIELLNDSVTQISIGVEHGGVEAITDPNNTVHHFSHWPIQLTAEYSPRHTPQLSDIADAHWNRQVMASDWASANVNAKVQAPVGPFTTWTLTISEAVNGKLRWEKVNAMYLEFCGSSFAFKR